MILNKRVFGISMPFYSKKRVKLYLNSDWVFFNPKDEQLFTQDLLSIESQIRIENHQTCILWIKVSLYFSGTLTDNLMEIEGAFTQWPLSNPS